SRFRDGLDLHSFPTRRSSDLGMAGIMLMFINDPVEWSTIGLALILFLVLRYFGDDTTVSCDEQGFKVKIVSKRKGTTVKEYAWEDRKSTRLNSSHVKISYAVF